MSFAYSWWKTWKHAWSRVRLEAQGHFQALNLGQIAPQIKGQLLSSSRNPYSLFKVAQFAKITRDNTKQTGVQSYTFLLIKIGSRSEDLLGQTNKQKAPKHQSPKTQDWRNSSVGKVHILLVWECEFDLQNPYIKKKSQVWWGMLVIWLLGRRTKTDSWDSLASRLAQPVLSRPDKIPCFRREGRSGHREAGF